MMMRIQSFQGRPVNRDSREGYLTVNESPPPISLLKSVNSTRSSSKEVPAGPDGTERLLVMLRAKSGAMLVENIPFCCRDLAVYTSGEVIKRCLCHIQNTAQHSEAASKNILPGQRL